MTTHADSRVSPQEESSPRPNELQAVILAAGYARRMQPLSDNCHKALLSVGGTTILGRIMEGLDHIGVQRVTIVTGYRAGDVERYLRNGYPDTDFLFVHNEQFRETNNIVSLSLAFDAMAFDKDIVLIECDLLFDRSLMTRLVDNPGRNVALVDRYRTGMDGTVVEIDEGYVSGVYPTDAQGADFSYVNKFKTLNIYRFDKDFCQAIFRPLLHTYANHIDSSCYYELVLGMLTNIRAHRISAEVVEGERWSEVDDPNDLAVSSFQFEPDRRAEILDRSFGGHWNFEIVDFSFMRNSYFPTGSMLAAMRHAFPELISNYGSAQVVLNEKMGYFLRCDPRRLEVLHGASQVFPILSRILNGGKVLVPTATFGEYQRQFPDAETYVDAPGIDWDSLARRANGFSVVCVVNPNTSTGTTLTSAEILALARRTPKTMFLVDESFLAFSDQPSLINLLKDDEQSNIAVLVSLSKSLGVPGLRLGYIYSSNRSLLDSINEEIPIWNLSSPSEFLLELMVKFGPAYERSLVKTKKDREQMRNELTSLTFVDEVPESGGNFLHVRLSGTDPLFADRIRRWLLTTHSIEVKNVTDKFRDNLPRLRIALRTAPENEKLIRLLEKLPGSL